MARRLLFVLRCTSWSSRSHVPPVASAMLRAQPQDLYQQRAFCGLQTTISSTSHPTCTHDFVGRRFYAKGKSKGKDKGKGKGAGARITLSPEELNSVVKYDRMTEHFQKVLEQLQRDYMTQLQVRTTSASFDQLSVETGDGVFPLVQLGQIAQKSPTLVIINLAAFPQYIPDVKTAFLNIGINPNQEGNSLIVPIPKVTREQRQNMASTAKMMCNKAKEKLRDIQNNFVRDVKKQKGKHSDDLIRSVHDHIQQDAHDFAAKAENLMTTKQKELLDS